MRVCVEQLYGEEDEHVFKASVRNTQPFILSEQVG